MLPLWARVDLGAMAIKGSSKFPRSSIITGTSQSDYTVSYPGDSLVGGLTPLQRSSRCVLPLKPTEQCVCVCVCLCLKEKLGGKCHKSNNLFGVSSFQPSRVSFKFCYCLLRKMFYFLSSNCWICSQGIKWRHACNVCLAIKKHECANSERSLRFGLFGFMAYQPL